MAYLRRAVHARIGMPRIRVYRFACEANGESTATGTSQLDPDSCLLERRLIETKEQPGTVTGHPINGLTTGRANAQTTRCHLCA